MSEWNLVIESNEILYSFWSFSRHGRGRNKYNILDATLGVYQTYPLSFKSTNEGLIIEGAHNPSKQMIKWKINNKSPSKKLFANIIHANKDSNVTVIEISYDKDKHCFELKNMEQTKKIFSISKLDLDLIIRQNFKMNMIFDVLRLICEYNDCIFDMNNNMNLIKYENLEYKEECKAPINIIDTTNATRESYARLEMTNELVNGDYERFMVECECKPCFSKSMTIAGIVSLHGGGTGYELRVTNRFGQCKFEWVFTTHWPHRDPNPNITKDKWMHNELAVNIDITKMETNNGWIYLKGEYDFVNELQIFTVDDTTISRRIKGKPQVTTGRGVEFGRGYASKDRIYYGLIRNVKIDGWD